MNKYTIDLTSSKSCLVVVDMINGFVFEGAICDSSINACTKPIINLIEKYIHHNQPIIAFRDSHPLNCNEFNSFPVHCVEGTHESELIDEIKIYESHMISLLKNSTNGFVQPQFLELFKKFLPLNNVIITGCCTDICVLQFALSLQGYINQHELKTDICVIKDAVQTFNTPNHNQEEYNEMAFKLMANAGIKLITTKEMEVIV